MKRLYILLSLFCLSVLSLPVLATESYKETSVNLSDRAQKAMEGLVLQWNSLQKQTNELQIQVDSLGSLVTTLETRCEESETLNGKRTEAYNSCKESLMNTTTCLNECSEKLTSYEMKLKTKNSILTVLIIILIIMILMKIAGYVLYAKGVKLPRWLDILL